MTATATIETIGGTDLCRRTNLSYRQLDYWVRVGVLVPSTPANGSGSQRRFPESEVRVVKVLCSLRDLGAGMDQLRRVALFLRQPDLDFAGRVFITAAGAVYRIPVEDAGLWVDLDAHDDAP